MASCSGGRALVHTMPPFFLHSRFSWRREANAAANRKLDDGVGEVGCLLSSALSLEKLTRTVCEVCNTETKEPGWRQQFGFLADVGKGRENGPSV